MISAALLLTRPLLDRKGQEVKTFMRLMILLVFLLLMLGVIIMIGTDFNPFKGENNICQLSFGLIRGCVS